MSILFFKGKPHNTRLLCVITIDIPWGGSDHRRVGYYQLGRQKQRRCNRHRFCIFL